MMCWNIEHAHVQYNVSHVHVLKMVTVLMGAVSKFGGV